eukprot:772969_1
MAAKTPEISLQRDLLRDFMPPTTSDLDIDPEWSRSRTMTLSSMFGSPEISCLLRIIAFLWRWSKPLGCIWIIAVETGLLIHIYWPHTVYFVLSLTFISVPLSISSLFIVYTSYQSMTSRFDSDRITYFSGLRRRCLELLLMIPVVNVLLMLLPPPVVLIKKVHYTLNWQSLFVLILSICMTLPQFFLNMSYIIVPSQHRFIECGSYSFIFDLLYIHIWTMSLSYLLIGFNTAKMICPLPLVPFMTTTYKALFEKRIVQQRASIDTAVTSYDEERSLHLVCFIFVD